MTLKELSFKSVNGLADRPMDRRLTNRWQQKVNTIAHPENSSGELKKKKKKKKKRQLSSAHLEFTADYRVLKVTLKILDKTATDNIFFFFFIFSFFPEKKALKFHANCLLRY